MSGRIRRSKRFEGVSTFNDIVNSFDIIDNLFKEYVSLSDQKEKDKIIVKARRWNLLNKKRSQIVYQYIGDKNEQKTENSI